MHTTTLELASGVHASGVGNPVACTRHRANVDNSPGNVDKFASGQGKCGDAATRPHRKGGRRAERFGLQSTLQAITTVNRVKACGWARISKHVAPAVVVNAGVAHIAGTQRCGSVWQCPVCGPKIRQGRAEELDTVLLRWLKAHGAGTVQLWTLTQPHTSGEPLAELRKTIRAAFRAICSGRQWQALREAYGIAHLVSALDVTHGPNGWHPHLHVLVLTDREATDDHVAAIRAHVFAQWDRALVARGRARPHAVHGLHIERAKSRADIGRYVCQVIGEADDDTRGWGVAQETARTDLKKSHHPGHRTPWQILADIRTRRAKDEWDALDENRDAKDCALWAEYETGMKGARAVSFSRGLRAAVGIDREQTDEELAEAEAGGDVVTTIESRAEWAAVRVTRGGMVRLLRVAESHGARGVRRLLRVMVHRKRNHRAVREHLLKLNA